MKLSGHDLKQINDNTLDRLPEEQLRTLSKLMLSDLKAATDRLNQNPTNSSRPSGSMAIWEREGSSDEEELSELEAAVDKSQNTDDTSNLEDAVSPLDIDGQKDNKKIVGANLLDGANTNAADNNSAGQPQKKSPGKQVGAQGHGRNWNPGATEESIHCYPMHCILCAKFLDEINHKAYTGYNQIDVQFGDMTNPGLVVTVTLFTLYANTCSCGHENRYDPKSSLICDGIWEGMQLSEWRLIGPMLASFIAHLKMEFRLPVRKICDILNYFGLYLSTGVIQHCFEESGAVVAPLEDALVDAVLEEALLYVDETGWKEKSNTLWLWVFCSLTIAYYCIGRRTKRLLQSVLRADFKGWLMTDGYGAYRHYDKRLRCWAHLLRKARGLSESTDAIAREFGLIVLALMEKCMSTVYRWRGESNTNEKTDELVNALAPLLEAFKEACEKYGGKDITHEKSSALAREFLNDWDAIFRILEHPYLPLTNNKAERALRPWVILRKICYGSRSAKGTKTFALLASVIDTCRLRKVNSLKFLAESISAARKGILIDMISSAPLGCEI
jgi:transposase